MIQLMAELIKEVDTRMNLLNQMAKHWQNIDR